MGPNLRTIANAKKLAEGKGPLRIFTSNDIETGKNQKDIAAFLARTPKTIACGVELESMGIQENEGNARLGKRKKRAAAAPIWKSLVLAQRGQKRFRPGTYQFYERSLGAFFSNRAALPNHRAATPQNDGAQGAWEGCAYFQ